MKNLNLIKEIPNGNSWGTSIEFQDGSEKYYKDKRPLQFYGVFGLVYINNEYHLLSEDDGQFWTHSILTLDEINEFYYFVKRLNREVIPIGTYRFLLTDKIKNNQIQGIFPYKIIERENYAPLISFDIKGNERTFDVSWLRSLEYTLDIMDNQEHLFTLTIGDYSGDGHEKTRKYVFKSNLALPELRQIYFDTRMKLGASLDAGENAKYYFHNTHKEDKILSVAPFSGYEDNKISPETILELGLNPLKYYTESEIEEAEMLFEDLEPPEFADLFIDFLKDNNPEIDINLELLELQEFNDYSPFKGRSREDYEKIAQSPDFNTIGGFGYRLFY